MSGGSFVLVINKNEARHHELLWLSLFSMTERMAPGCQESQRPHPAKNTWLSTYWDASTFFAVSSKLRVGKGFYSWQKLITLSLLSIGHIYSLDTCSLQEVKGLGRGPGWRERCVAAKPLYRRSRLNISSHIYFWLINCNVIGPLTRPSIIIG